MGDTVVLLHAMGSSHRMWRAQIEALGERYEVLAPDLPGHGGHAGRFTIAAAVAELRDRLPRPAHVIGASLGATVALELALRHPETTASLLLSGAAVHASPVVVAVQRAVTAALPLAATAALSARIVRPAARQDRDALVADIRRAGKRAQHDALRELERWDPRPRLHTIGVPTLVCCGERDRANLPSARTLAERIPGARLTIVPGGGHLWNLQRPEACTETISSFLESTARRPDGG